MAREQFKHYALTDVDTLTEYLEAIIKGFQSGSLDVSAEGQQLIFQPGGLVSFEIEAKRQNGLSRLSLKLSWDENEGALPTGEPLRLRPGLKPL